MISFPNAKINLGLNIVNKRPDGYHDIETIFYPIPLEDMLEIAEDTSLSSDYHLQCSGLPIDGDPESNLIIKAYRMLKKDFKLPPIQIHLHKAIPSGAGLGGGSSDAASMLKLLNKNFDLMLSNEQLEAYAAQLGADCAFFVRNQPTFAEGIGNVFTALDLSLQGYQLYLIKPNVFISTVMAYGSITPKRPQASLTEIIKRPVSEWRNHMFNDFEAPIFQQFPELQHLKNKLYEAGAAYAAMSGSGSSIYGLFKGKCPLKENPHEHQYILNL